MDQPDGRGDSALASDNMVAESSALTAATMTRRRRQTVVVVVVEREKSKGMSS